MAFDALLKGIVRGRYNDVAPSGDEFAPHLSGQRELLIAPGKPSLAEIVRQGDSWWVQQATAVAPVVALPTTTAQLTIQNTNPDGGKSLILDSIFGHILVSAGAATAVGVVGMLNVGRLALLTDDAALTVRSFSGKRYGGLVLKQVGATVVDDGWRNFGNAQVGAASQIMQTFEFPLDGKVIVPPGAKFSLAVVANTVTTITTRVGVGWHEVSLVLG